jgi:hypothetical protein
MNNETNISVQLSRMVLATFILNHREIAEESIATGAIRQEAATLAPPQCRTRSIEQYYAECSEPTGGGRRSGVHVVANQHGQIVVLFCRPLSN